MNRSGLVALVIDDEVQIRRFLRAGFELEGFIVQEAATGADGIRAATLKSVDLVIVDLELPDIDGAEIVERLRAWSTVPTIVLSVRSSEEEKVRLLELGADDYVVKPFGMAELLARARAALRRQAARLPPASPWCGRVRSPSTSPRGPCRSTACPCSSRPRNTG